jgi:hypothetical protein
MVCCIFGHLYSFPTLVICIKKNLATVELALATKKNFFCQLNCFQHSDQGVVLKERVQLLISDSWFSTIRWKMTAPQSAEWQVRPTVFLKDRSANFLIAVKFFFSFFEIKTHFVFVREEQIKSCLFKNFAPDFDGMDPRRANIYMYIHTYIHTYICTYLGTCTHTYIHMYVNTQTTDMRTWIWHTNRNQL